MLELPHCTKKNNNKIYGTSACVYYQLLSIVGELIEGDPEASFSMSATPSFRGGCYSILWIVPL